MKTMMLAILLLASQGFAGTTITSSANGLAFAADNAATKADVKVINDKLDSIILKLNVKPPVVSPSPTPTPVPPKPNPTPVPPVTGTSPSGEAMPVGDIAGYKQVFKDDFLAWDWNMWEFPQGFQYEKSWVGGNAELNNGVMNLKATRAAGDNQAIVSWMQNKKVAQLYGKYLIRMRANKMQGFAIAPLLWPASEKWPQDGEVDFAEDYTGERKLGAFSHYADATGAHQQTWHTDDAPKVSGEDWHTWGVDWTKDAVKYTLDGKVWATDTGAAVPQTPMWLGFVGACHQECVVGRGDWEIDYVVIYAPTGATTKTLGAAPAAKKSDKPFKWRPEGSIKQKP